MIRLLTFLGKAKDGTTLKPSSTRNVARGKWLCYRFLNENYFAEVQLQLVKSPREVSRCCTGNGKVQNGFVPSPLWKLSGILW